MIRNIQKTQTLVFTCKKCKKSMLNNKDTKKLHNTKYCEHAKKKQTTKK